MTNQIKIIALVICIAALIAACGGGGGGGSSAPEPFSIIGTWGMDTTNGAACHNCIILQFNADGTGYVQNYIQGIKLSGTWSFDGTTLVMCRDGMGCTSERVFINSNNSITIGVNVYSRR